MELKEIDCGRMLPGCAEQFGAIRTTQEQQGELLHRIEGCLRGNGTIGLATRVEILESTAKNNGASNRWWISFLFGVAGVAAAVLAIFWK